MILYGNNSDDEAERQVKQEDSPLLTGHDMTKEKKVNLPKWWRAS